MNVTINDISKRSKAKVTIINPSEFNLENMRLYADDNTFIENNAFHVINHWAELNENTNIAFNKALDVFSEICENCNDYKINETCEFLLQEANKVRDAVQLQNSIKHKTSRLKTKISTKIQNKINDASDNLNNSIGNIQSKLKPAIGSAPSSQPSDTNVSDDESNGKGIAEESFKKLYNKAKVLAECDRILRNYNKICKRFDINKMVSEICSDDDIYACVNEICSCIDDYQIPFINKYNTSLETVFYALGKNYLQYPSDKIIEAVTDYYIFNTTLDEQERSSIKTISNNSVIFESVDFDCVSFL